MALSAHGDTLPGHTVAWESYDTSVATVSATGLVTARHVNATVVRATIDSVYAEGTINVVQGVVSITLADSDSVVQGQSLQLTAVVKDSTGAVLSNPQLAWSSTSGVNAPINPNTGLLSAVAASNVTVTAFAEGVSAQSKILILGPVKSLQVQPAIDTVVLGASSQLSVTVTDAAGHRRPLPGPVTWTSSFWSVQVSSSGLVTAIGTGDTTVTASVAGASGSADIVGVFDGPLTAVSIADSRTCALTSASVYCWGSVSFPIPGLSSGDPPVSIVRAVRFGGAPVSTALAISPEDGCLLSAAGAASCWGSDINGELGNDTVSQVCQAGKCSTAAVPVLGGLAFSQLAADRDHTCGLTVAGAVYCWGSGANGELGNGIRSSSSLPIPVSGGLTFSRISVGTYHTCAVGSDSLAYCWGRNEHGQVGIGVVDTFNTAPQLVPAAVSGVRKFIDVVAGGYSTCGLEAGGTVSCWGENSTLVSGSGSFLAQPTSVQGASGLTALAGGGDFGGLMHLCGLTGSGQVMCWGTGGNGETGPNLPFGGLTPTLVPLPSGSASISAGALGSCAHLGTGPWYCWGGATLPGGQQPTRIIGQR